MTSIGGPSSPHKSVAPAKTEAPAEATKPASTPAPAAKEQPAQPAAKDSFGGTAASPAGPAPTAAGAQPAKPAATERFAKAPTGQLEQMTRDPAFRRLDPAAQQSFMDAMQRTSNVRDQTAIREAATSPAFGALSPADQRTRSAEVCNAVKDPRFKTTPQDLRGEVIQSAAAGRGTGVELMNAATFTPGVGIQLTGSAADQGTYTAMMRRAMVRSPSFRAEMNAQNTDGAHPIRMDLGRGQANTFVDASGVFFTPPAPGRHTVDLDDIQRFPADPGRAPQPNATTQDQNIIHFMVEARREAAGNTFQVSHRAGTDAENRFRREMGQAGELVDVRERPGHPGQVLFEYRNGHNNETIHVDPRSQITRIDY